MPDIITLTFNPALDCSTATAMILADEKLRCDPPRYDPGGGGINVARMAHALGEAVVALFPAGGLTGDYLAALVTATGTPFLRILTAGATRENLSIVDRRSGAQYRFVLPGPPLRAVDQQSCIDELARLAPSTRYVVVSGSLPADVPPNLLPRIADLCRAHDCRLVLDTSGEGLQQARTCHAFLLKPNADELAQLAGRSLLSEADEEQAARLLIDQGFAEVLLVSLGDRGAMVVTRQGVDRCRAIPIVARTKVGAGDTMVAAVVVALTRGWTLATALRFGVAAGAAALIEPGTQLARPEALQGLYEAHFGDLPAIDQQETLKEVAG
ncbi:1-phosphofructokinase family hexose kinase [Sphingomonas parapaucimobilis]|uniref:1-phosphofructokinase family hexose kinase n=1 Tax=Sphingomonas parapaucimobilis TaxID=28213 RepID=UPI0035C7E777